MSYLKFDKAQLINLEYSLGKEILRTNRAGSYSLSTIIGCNTRKYHGLLVCPVDYLDSDKHVLLSSLDETVIQKDSEFNLGIHKYQGDNYAPKGHKYVRDFEVDSSVKIVYRVGNVVLNKEIVMADQEDQVLIKYTLEDALTPITLRLKPFLAFRNMHELSKANMHAQTKVEFIPKGIKTHLYDGYPYLHMQCSSENEFIIMPDWYYNIEYMEEQKRGFNYKEDLFVPGFFELNLKKGESFVFSAAISEVKPEGLKRKFTAQVQKRIERVDLKSCLLNAAEQFIISRNNETDIVAGFPWFTSWGRDTFISLPGLTLALDKPDECKSILTSMVKKQKLGVFPKISDPNNLNYSSADTSLWFIWTLQQYTAYTNKPKEVWKEFGKNIKDVIYHYSSSTHDLIKMHDNGLIFAGSINKPLTWMDAVVDGEAVTPRNGYAVEINALWYNALMFALELAKASKDTEFINSYKELTERVKDSFIKIFWDKKKGYLADYDDGVQKDWSVRCNMIIAAALDYTPLDNEQIKGVLDMVQSELLTPLGLRTLSPKNEDYIGIYEGNAIQRDLAYHQGTVWPWTLEYYVKAYLKLYKESGVAKVKRIIDGLEKTMNEHGIGTISELYDGNPPHAPKGAISQAWSVAAFLNIINMIEQYN